MASKKKAVKKLPQSATDNRRTHGRARPDGQAMFPVAPLKGELPQGYGEAFVDIRRRIGEARLKAVLDIRRRIGEARLKAVLDANATMIDLYWGVGRVLLARQAAEGRGAKVIDRLSADLRDAFPDMSGLSPRNLKYMRAFAAAWPDEAIVQSRLHKLTWYHHLALLEHSKEAAG